MKKVIISYVIIFVLALSVQAIGENLAPLNTKWQNVCPDPNCPEYCSNIGKIAYNAYGTKIMKTLKLGKIIGVCWRIKGSLISTDGRVSPRDAYYYIIDDGWGPEKAFIRQCREIKAK